MFCRLFYSEEASALFWPQVRGGSPAVVRAHILVHRNSYTPDIAINGVNRKVNYYYYYLLLLLLLLLLFIIIIIISIQSNIYVNVSALPHWCGRRVIEISSVYSHKAQLYNPDYLSGYILVWSPSSLQKWITSGNRTRNLKISSQNLWPLAFRTDIPFKNYK